MIANTMPTSELLRMPVEVPLNGLWTGLGLLWRAYNYACTSGAELWDFALETKTLYDTGLTVSDLRWLVARRFAEHGQEISVYGSPHRAFHTGTGFYFEPTTCVVLTAAGAEFAAKVLREAPAEFGGPGLSDLGGHAARNRPDVSEASAVSGPVVKPCWNISRRELSVAGQLVKRFRVPAQNQELILCAFEEEGWPDCIDDPLPMTSDRDTQTRLHDAINRLNGRQANPLLRFHGNGNGTGVSWEVRLPRMMP